MIDRVEGYREAGERTGDGRVRSESWHVFWIGSERLSEKEDWLDIGHGEGAVMRAAGRREAKGGYSREGMGDMWRQRS